MTDDGTGVASGTRRRWRKRIFLIVGCGCLLLLGREMMWERPLAIIRLPEGSQFTIHKTTVGKEHSYYKAPWGLTSAEIWANKWLTRVNRQIAVSNRNIVSRTTLPMILFWHTFDWSRQVSEATPFWMILTDERGWRTAGDLTHMHGSSGRLPAGFRPLDLPPCFAVEMPSSSGTLKVDLLNSNKSTLGSSQIFYTVPKDRLQSWSPRQLPAKEQDGNMTVELFRVKAEWPDQEFTNSWPGDALKVDPEYTVTVDGRVSNDWIPYTGGAPLLESVLVVSQAEAYVESNIGVVAPLQHCTISPFNETWRLGLSLICRNPATLASADVVEIPGISFNGKSSTSSDSRIELTETDGDSTLVVKLMGAGRAGSYSYQGPGEAPFPFTLPWKLKHMTKGALEGTFLVAPAGPQSFAAGGTLNNGPVSRPLQSPVKVSLNLTLPRPHFVLSVTGAGDRFPYIIVKDPRGQELDGELHNAQGLLIWLAKRPCDEIDRVNATLLLQVPRLFTFDIAPPAPPPRQRNGKF
ncbi:hypothetical protein [Schlesneria sp. T3-172]|uniref:hypothetical protein n=3 Tax=Schlesneria TaxID=656899 RepID=UPI0037C93CF9